MAKKDDVEVIGPFQIPGDASPQKKVPFWKKTVFVKGLIAGGILGIIVVFFVHESKSSVPHATSVVSAPPLPSQSGGVSKNPEYQRKISILNKERARLAVRNGQSSVPTVGGDEKAGDIGREEKNTAPAAPPPPMPAGQSIESNRMEARMRAYDAARTLEVASVDKELGGILSTWSGAGGGMAVLSVPKPAGTVVSAGKNSPGARQKSPGKPGKGIPIIPAGKILYGRIINELNSDRPGPVLAEAVGGKFDGVKFLGSFQRDNGALVIKFDRVIYPDGQTDSIGAYAVSPGTKLRSGLETDVNNHYLYRYGSLLASAFMQGFGQAAMYSNSTSYPSSFGTPVIGFNGMTLMQQTEMGLGQAGMMLGGQAMNAFNTPPTVKVAADTPVGLMIVAETGQKLPKSSSSAGNAPAKPGLVNAPGPQMVPQPGYPQPMMGGGYPGYGGGYGMPMMPMMP
ncbi:MAG: DotG/IcmE/VirB10 family type IV secretion system protein [Leptospirales bacterium]